MAIPHQRPLELELLCHKLQADFSAHITGEGETAQKRESNFYSKAVAAFVLCEAAGASPADAASASIDGRFDCGIDSVYVDSNHIIWLVQAKYIQAGIGEPDLGDVAKFAEGVRYFLEHQWQRFNPTMQARQAELEKALNDDLCQIRIVLAHTGGAINDDRRDIFGDLERMNNATSPDFLQFNAYGWSSLYEMLDNGQANVSINAELELSDFGVSMQPYHVVYGRLSAAQLSALWAEHEDKLVERNIRRFKGSTSVNEGLEKTLAENSEHFFYFNNGVTFVCEAIKQIGARPQNRATGKFKLEGLSIINGAQTVGVIGRQSQEPNNPQQQAAAAEVLATIICLAGAPEEFGAQVTQFRNRQNAVDLKDFAALDEDQHHWQQVLKLAGVDYVLKHGEDDPPHSATCFSVSEAAPILACTLSSNNWMDFVIAAKADQKKLFGRQDLVAASHPLHNAYDKIFTASLTCKQLWRAVQIGRLVLNLLRERAKSETDASTRTAEQLPTRDILKHSTWLLLHVLFVRLNLQHGADFTLNEAEKTRISQECDRLAQCVVQVVQAQNWQKQAKSVFENKTDCKNIKNGVMRALASQS